MNAFMSANDFVGIGNDRDKESVLWFTQLLPVAAGVVLSYSTSVMNYIRR